MNLGAFWALPTCTECGVRCAPFHQLTHEHTRLGVKPLGSHKSGLCADCYRTGYRARRRAKARAWDQQRTAAA